MSGVTMPMSVMTCLRFIASTVSKWRDLVGGCAEKSAVTLWVSVGDDLYGDDGTGAIPLAVLAVGECHNECSSK